MKWIYPISKKILSFIDNSSIYEIEIGCSSSQVFHIQKEEKSYYLKIAQKGKLTSEYEKLRWLDGKLEVPKVVLYDSSEEAEYLITEAISGEMICSKYYEENPEIGISVLRDAFRKIHSVDIEDCPFDVSNHYKLSLVESNVENGLVKDSDLGEKTRKKFGNVLNVLQFLKDHSFEEEPCFSHGDTSLPNIFAQEDTFTGMIDVGECGIADKWFDLAICEKSIRRNYGEEYINRFYEALNIIPDREKIDYYLLMMELYE